MSHETKISILSSHNARLLKENYNRKYNLDLVALSPQDNIANTLGLFKQTPDIEHVTYLFHTPHGRVVVPNSFFVHFKPQVSEEQIRALNRSYGVRIVRKIEWLGNNYLMEVDWGSEVLALDTANLYHELPFVEFASPNFVLTIKLNSVYPNDPDFTPQKQWNLNDPQNDKDIDAVEAWEITKGDPNIIIAIMDAGMWTGHEDLDYADGRFVKGYNYSEFPPEEINPDEVYGPKGNPHGLAVAEVAAASTDNGFGIAGVSWYSKIMPLILSYPVPLTEEIVNAFEFATEHWAHVINITWDTTPDDEIDEAIETAADSGRGGKGCIIVASSGNEEYGDRSTRYPATHPAVIAVGATDQNGDIWEESCWGDVYAPGDMIWTYDWDDEKYEFVSGTSFAAPQVAGIAALILSVDSTLTRGEVEAIITSTTGENGRVNAFEALKEAAGYIEVPEDYPSIQEAINAASWGQTVWVDPGEYEEAVSMKSGVNLFGTGSNATTIVQYGSSYAVRFWGVSDSKLRGFKVVNDGNIAIRCYDVPHDEVFIEECDITDSYMGIFSYNHSYPEIRYNNIHGNQYGVFAYYHSDPEVYDAYNDISGNQAVGVYCRYYSEPSLGYYYDYTWGRNRIINIAPAHDIYAEDDCATIFAIRNYWGEGREPNVHHENPNYEIVCDPVLEEDPLGKGLAGGQVARNDAKQHNLRGKGFYFQGKYQEALAEFFYVIDNYPQTQEALFALDNVVMTYRRMGNKAGALSYLSDLAQRWTNTLLGAKALELTIPFEIDKGNYQFALSRLDALRQNFPRTEMAMHLLFQKGMIYKYDLGDADKARQTFEAFIQKYPEDELVVLAQMELNSLKKPGDKGLVEIAQANFALSQNYPNPANPITRITFTLPERAKVTLEIYNLLGQRVRRLVEGVRDAAPTRLSGMAGMTLASPSPAGSISTGCGRGSWFGQGRCSFCGSSGSNHQTRRPADCRGGVSPRLPRSEHKKSLDK